MGTTDECIWKKRGFLSEMYRAIVAKAMQFQLRVTDPLKIYRADVFWPEHLMDHLTELVADVKHAHKIPSWKRRILS
jgi:hypothetical protein